MKQILGVKGLSVFTAAKALLHDVSFSLNEGENLVVLGKNGAGKSTLSQAVMGNTSLRTEGDIIFCKDNISTLSADKRSLLGMFLSFQNPPSIEGLNISELLRTSLEVRGQRTSLREFKLKLSEKMELLGLNPLEAERDLGSAFSGGEKKKLEILQILMLQPKLVILDEIDSGLDISAARKMSQILANYQQETGASFIIITHNFRILKELSVSKTLLLEHGTIATTGGPELIDKIQKEGFK